MRRFLGTNAVRRNHHGLSPSSSFFLSFSSSRSVGSRPITVSRLPPGVQIHPQQQQQQQQQFQRMSFHFASSDYTQCFQDVPQPDVAKIRQSAIDYLHSFDPQLWYDDPISSILNGQELRGGQMIDTVDALGRVNGKQVYATSSQMDALRQHIQTYQSPSYDYRIPIRRIEQKFLSSSLSGFLIGNQCLDFQKQDGVTEIEEAIMANHIERQLNDLLLHSETTEDVSIHRKPIYISCVSNFTNFLDLFRKTMRSLEVGIPCIILGRSNTVQHSYRWTKLLSQLAIEEGIDSGMITYLSCPIEDIIHMTQDLQEYTGNLYTTCSRDLASSIKLGYDNVIASTGGPNTFITTDWTPSIQDAIRISASIECAGQCTALRHAVIPTNVVEKEVQDIFDKMMTISSATTSLKDNVFDGVFTDHIGSPAGPSDEGYIRHPTTDASYRITKQDELPPHNLNEHWRKVVVDVSKMDLTTNNHMDDLIDWLNVNQPISIAVTGKTREEGMKLGFELWSRTGLVVNTIGTTESPALTCQARPQEAEVFGEFPPRKDLFQYTKFPVIVPSSNPSYDTTYTTTFLIKQASKKCSGLVGDFLKDISDEITRGYCVTLLEYLQDATNENPKRGFGTKRTAMWGLQRPPLKTMTYLSCHHETSWDELSPSLFLFFVTNAKEQVQVVVPSENKTILTLCEKYNIPMLTSISEDTLHPGDNVYLVKNLSDTMQGYPMVGQFVTTLLPIGHIKSTLPDDDEFVKAVRVLPKWLKMS